ncbi:MAG TPA: hypothetical protein VEA18_01130 [Candidatus Kapabacteria bacterium]|nr:hypothetical protein [Candidatus Kapabacteria bacterium]
MNRVSFLIFGYGVPKNILEEPNYDRYLHTIFNTIYTETYASTQTSLIVFCGGKTDCMPPYTRTEAGEMIRLFKTYCARPAVRSVTKKWSLVPEATSLSTLENFVYGKEVLERRTVTGGNIVVFCEATRKKRVERTGKRVLGKKYTLRVIPVDFDSSPNRYLDPTFLENKEQKVWKEEMKALQSNDALRAHHRKQQEKLAYLRAQGSKRHAAAVKTWWENILKERSV